MIEYYDPFDKLIITAPKSAATFEFCPYAKYLRINDGEPVNNSEFSAEVFNDHQIERRKKEYKESCDDLAFAYLADEITKQEWKDARQAIKDKYPKVEV